MQNDIDMDNSFYKPSKEEFLAYANKEDWIDWAEELWEELEKRNWQKKDKSFAPNWQTMANSINSVVMHRLGISKSSKKKSGKIKDEEDFPASDKHYVGYIAGSCDYYTEKKVGAAAYIIMKQGELFFENAKSFTPTTDQRMHLLAIVSVVMRCEDGAFVDIYTDNVYCNVFNHKDAPKINVDLYNQYKEQSARLGGIHIHILRTSESKVGEHYDKLKKAKQMAFEVKKANI